MFHTVRSTGGQKRKVGKDQSSEYICIIYPSLREVYDDTNNMFRNKGL